MSIEVDDFLAHYGKKGMRWGVVHEPEKTPRNTASLRKATDSFFSKKNSAELKAESSRKEAKKKEQTFPKGSKPKDSSNLADQPLKTGRLSKKQKAFIGVGAGLAIAGLAYYGNSKLSQNKGVDGRQLLGDELASLFGPKTSRTTGSGKGDFFGGLQNKKAFDRPEFVIPKGTTFQRISTVKESGSGFSNGAYASFLSNDKLIYQNGYGSGDGDMSKYTKINFKADGDIRVPTLKTVLDAVKEVGDGTGKRYTDEEAVSAYTSIAGGFWNEGSGAQVISRLKKQGYSAIVDDMDAGRHGDLPIVFFGNATEVTYSGHDTSYKAKSIREKSIVDMDHRYA